MSSAAKPGTLGMNRENFRRRQSDALVRRLQSLPVKVLAHALGVHGDTVSAWARGASTMDGAAIHAVDQFFADRGDWGFIGEIYGDLGVRREKRAQQLEAEARRLRETARLLSHEAAA